MVQTAAVCKYIVGTETIKTNLYNELSIRSSLNYLMNICIHDLVYMRSLYTLLLFFETIEINQNKMNIKKNKNNT